MHWCERRPGTVRIELPLLKQEESETLEEFSQRVPFQGYGWLSRQKGKNC